MPWRRALAGLFLFLTLPLTLPFFVGLVCNVLPTSGVTPESWTTLARQDATLQAFSLALWRHPATVTRAQATAALGVAADLAFNMGVALGIAAMCLYAAAWLLEDQYNTWVAQPGAESHWVVESHWGTGAKAAQFEPTPPTPEERLRLYGI